jgi:hypothetical protein
MSAQQFTDAMKVAAIQNQLDELAEINKGLFSALENLQYVVRLANGNGMAWGDMFDKIMTALAEADVALGRAEQ